MRNSCIFLSHQQILWNLQTAIALVPPTLIYLPSVAAADKASTNPPPPMLLRQFKHPSVPCEGKIFQPGSQTVKNPCKVFTFPTSLFTRLLALILLIPLQNMKQMEWEMTRRKDSLLLIAAESCPENSSLPLYQRYYTMMAKELLGTL